MDETISSSLFDLARKSVPARAVFVARFMGSTTLASVTLGLVCGQLGAACSSGPLVPFLVGSWVGYSLACYRFWRLEVLQALHYVYKYPKLVEHALRTEFASVSPIIKEPFLDWIRAGSIGRLTWTILATQSCLPHIKEVEEAEMQYVVERYKVKSQSAFQPE